MIHMIKRKNIFITIIASLTMLLGISYIPAVVNSAPQDDVCEGIQLTGGGANCNPPPGSPTVSGTLETAINILSIIVGVAAVIMIIVGGLQYILSAGDSAKTGTAKNTILYAVIGLAIVALSQVIVNFVLNRVSP